MPFFPLWLFSFENECKIAPVTTRNQQTKWPKHSDTIREAVDENPDRTLDKRLDHLKIGISRSTLCRALKALKLTIKKVLNAAEQERPDVNEKRREWIAGQASLDPEKLVFIDETWLKTNMTRPRGSSLKGKRLGESVPFGHWIRTTFVAALLAILCRVRYRFDVEYPCPQIGQA